MRQIFLWQIIFFALVGCARVGSPVGGARDTIAPKMTGSNIDSARVNVPRNIKELRIDFDEYIMLKDIGKNLIISPPVAYTKITPSALGSRQLVIQWKDTLQENTTYNFNFGNSIVDMNEGNVLPYFNFAFSTGNILDDFYISGTISDALGNEKNSEGKERNLVVGLFREQDSVNYRQKPYYIAKADPDGYFELNYLTPGKYRIIGFDDENSNSVYDAEKENVAFQKDLINLQKSVSGLRLRTFPSRKMVSYKEIVAVPGGVQMIFQGKPDKVTVRAVGEKPANYRITHLPKSDTLRVWFDAAKENIGATVSENLRFSYDTGIRQDTVSIFYRRPAKDEMTITNPFGNKLAPGSDFRFSSNYQIEKIQPENWELETDSTSQKFSAKISDRDSTQVLVRGDFVTGKKYRLTVPKNTLSSFYSKSSESVRFDFEVATLQDFGSFTVHLANPPAQKFWIQLLNEKNDVVYQQYTGQDEIKFANLAPASYRLRILVDNNGNGIWDSADLASGTAAEDAYLFRKSADTGVLSKISIRPMWEINENWDLSKEEQPN